MPNTEGRRRSGDGTRAIEAFVQELEKEVWVPATRSRPSARQVEPIASRSPTTSRSTLQALFGHHISRVTDLDPALHRLLKDLPDVTATRYSTSSSSS